MLPDSCFAFFHRHDYDSCPLLPHSIQSLTKAARVPCEASRSSQLPRWAHEEVTPWTIWETGPGERVPLEGHCHVPSFDCVYNLIGGSKTEASSAAGIQYETGGWKGYKMKTAGENRCTTQGKDVWGILWDINSQILGIRFFRESEDMLLNPSQAPNKCHGSICLVAKGTGGGTDRLECFLMMFSSLISISSGVLASCHVWARSGNLMSLKWHFSWARLLPRARHC